MNCLDNATRAKVIGCLIEGCSVRATVRMTGVSKEGVFWFGAPRWLYREMLTNFAKWLLTPEGKRRFYHKLRTYESMGKIAESRRLSPTA